MTATNRAWAGTNALQQATTPQRRLQHRLDRAAQRLIRVPDPRHVGGYVERCVESPARGVGDADAGLTGDELGAQIIGVAAQPCRPDQRTQIGDEPVVTRHQLIKLAAGRRILVLEAHGPLWHRLAQLLDAAIRRDAREHPGAALLVHQAARAVERIDEQPPATITLTRTVR